MCAGNPHDQQETDLFGVKSWKESHSHAMEPSAAGQQSSAIQLFWNSHQVRTIGGRSLAPETVVVEGSRESENLGFRLGSRVLSLCPSISTYSIKIINKTRHEYWSLDVLMYKKYQFSPSTLHVMPSSLFLLSVTSPAHAPHPKCQLPSHRHHRENHGHRQGKPDHF